MNNMKTNARALLLEVAVTALVGIRAFSQPTNTQPSLHIDPQTGLLVSTGSNATRLPTDFFNPATGLLWNETNVVSSDEISFLDDLASNLYLQAQTFTAKGQYEQALQCFLKLYAQDNSMLSGVLFDWVELGRKYPKAARSLTEIRDRDMRAFSQNQGTFKLFQELYDLNGALDDGGATHALFMDLRKNQPSLAGECYFIMEPALVQRGEYQLCLECIGNPDTRFNIYCHTFQRLQALYEGMRERSEATTRKMEEFSQQPGGPPMSPYPYVNPGKKGVRLTTDQYANNVCRLIEILVGTGHKEEAEKICGKAMAVLDDPRLQSAVSDADEKIQKRSTPAVTSGGK
jgi:tetratricopeptide (TPR) repeat protein